MIRHGDEHDIKTKTRWDLLPWKALKEVAKVATYGAQKHGDNSWREGDQSSILSQARGELDGIPPAQISYAGSKGLTASEAFGAMMRHMNELIEASHKQGSMVDIESGLPIAAHMAWNALAILEIVRERPELNDLGKVTL